MASIIEQLMDLFVFTCCESCELGLAMADFGIGEKKQGENSEGRPIDVEKCGNLQKTLKQVQGDNISSVQFFARKNITLYLRERVENQVELAKLRFLNEGLISHNQCFVKKCLCAPASGREINLYAPSEELAQSWLFLKYFDLCRANNKCFVLQQQGGACLSEASCDATGKTITVISERRSGRELLWFLSCRYKKETAGYGAAKAPQERLCPLKESGHAKRENQTMMSFRRHEVSKESSRIYPRPMWERGENKALRKGCGLACSFDDGRKKQESATVPVHTLYRR